MDLSIITVNYNSCQYIRQCIESTRHLDAGLSWEMLVVDNGSVDESIDYLDGLAAKMPRLKIIKVGSNRGFAPASNLGATRARGKFLMFLNPDARLSGRGIYKLIEFYLAKNKNEKVGAIGPRIINPDGTLQYNVRSFPGIWRQFLESCFLYRIKAVPFFSSYFLSWWDHRSIRKVDWISGACLFIEKDKFLEAGGFDPGYFMYSEDTDLCLQLVRKGYSNYYFPFFTVIHADSGIASRDMALRLFQIWKSRVIYFTKNYSRPYSRAVSCLYFLGMLNRIFLSFLTGKPQKAAQFGRAIKYYFSHGYKQ